MRLGVPIQKPELPAHGRVAVLEAPPADRRADRALRASLGPVRADAPVAPPVKSLDGSDTVVRARSVAGDRLLPTSKWHLHNWRPGPDDFAFFPEKEHLDVHRLAPAVLVGEL